MIHTIDRFMVSAVSVLSNLLMRLVALAALVCLLYFPVFKGNLLAYAPVLIGLCIAFCLAGLFRKDRGLPVLRRGLAAVTAMSEGRFLMLILLPPALLQAVSLLVLQPVPIHDPFFVFREARELAATGRMSPITYYPPLPTWWFAFFIKVFGPQYLTAQLSLIPLGAALAYVNYRTARELLAEKSVVRLASLLIAYYPGVVIYALATPGYFYHYTFFIMLLALLFLLMIRAVRSASVSFLTGVVAGLGALAKPVLLVAPAQVFIALFFSQGSFFRKRLWARIMLLAAGFCLALGPWVIRNYRVFNEFIPVCTYGPLTFYSANNPESNGLYSPVADNLGASTPEEILELGRLSNARAKEWIAGNPGDFLKLSLNKVLYTWGNEATFAELVNYRGKALEWLDLMLSILLQSGWSAAVFLWALAAWRGWREKRPPTPYDVFAAVIVVSNFLLYFLFEGGARHHVPLVPLILLYAAGVLAAGGRRAGNQ